MIFAKNKKAAFEYNFEKYLTAGMVLTGSEVKSIRKNSCSIGEAYCSLRLGEAFIIGMHISPALGTKIPDPKREKKLLLKKKEINKIIGYRSQGLSVIPIEVFSKGSFIKILLGVGKGSKKIDKREKIKARDIRKINKEKF